MELISVVSSDLSAIGYDEYNQQLEIVFNSGGTYLYSGVPSSVYEGLLNAGSKADTFTLLLKVILLLE